MLRKLIKYEIKASSRMLVPLYIALLAVAFVNRFMNPFEIIQEASGFNLQVIIKILSALIYYALIVGTLISSFIILIYRFYKNLLADEGYLSFTLPVETWQHILSKLITSVIWVILSIVVVISSILIVANISNFFQEFRILMETLAGEFGKSIFIELPAYLLVTLVYSILIIYNSISIGQLFQKYKIVASFVAYFAFYFISQTILLITLLLFNFNNLSLLEEKNITSSFRVFGPITAVLLLLSIGHFISANYFLKKRLNLE